MTDKNRQGLLPNNQKFPDVALKTFVKNHQYVLEISATYSEICENTLLHRNL